MSRTSRSIALSGLLLLAGAASAAEYTVTTVDFPGAEGGTSVAGIDVRGRIVGAYVVAGSRDSFGFTEKAGIFTSLGSNLPCEPTRCRTAAALINGAGEVAGQFSAHADYPGAFVWSANQLRIITPPGYPNTAVTLAGINDQGVLAGCYSTPEGSRIFLDSHGHFTTPTLPVPGTASACATDVNNRGQLIGTYVTNKGSQHAFVQTGPKAKSFDVPLDWGMDTNPVELNDGGAIIGMYSAASDFSTHGFLRAKERMIRIDYPGAASTFVSAINNRGEIAGMYLPAKLSAPTMLSFRAFVVLNGQYTALLLPGSVQAVTGINDRGEIVGTYYDPKCTHNCGVHGFRAAPNN